MTSVKPTDMRIATRGHRVGWQGVVDRATTRPV